MQCFPQLLTGASSQYPIRKRRSIRTVRNQCPDGREIKLADPAAESVEWELVFLEITDTEIATLLQFFHDTEGRLGSFTFLDPADNLCAWSEKFDEAVWQKDPLLQVGGDVPDPFGTSRAWLIVNPGAAPLSMRQTLNVPASFYYSFSLWVRSGLTNQVALFRGSESAVCKVGAEWQRLVFAGSSLNGVEPIAFGLDIPPGGAVDVFGAQVEAQIGASGYKPTTSRAGVYPNARFLDDALALTTLGPGRHGCVVRIRAS